MPRGGPQATQQVRPGGSATTPRIDQASLTASSGPNATGVWAPALPQRSTRMKRVFGRRNSLSYERVMPTPFVLDHPGPTPHAEGDSLLTSAERARAASTDHGVSPASETPLGVQRPAPPHPHTSRKPLRHLIPTSFFHPGSSSSLANKRSLLSDSIKPSSPPPPLPPPKPSKLRAVARAHEKSRTRSIMSSESEHASNEFPVENLNTAVSSDSNLSGFRFPPKSPIQSEASSSKNSHSQPSVDSRGRESDLHTSPAVVPHIFARPEKISKSLLDLPKRRSTSLGDITMFPTTGSSAASSSSGLRFPKYPAGIKSSDSIAAFSASTSDGSNSGTETSVGGFSQSRSTSLATWTPPQTVLAQSTLQSRYRATSAADTPYRSSPEPTKSLASSTSSSASAAALPPPRHPGASASLSVPRRAGATERAGRSSSPLRDTAISAAVGGLLLGRKGWDRMERLWNSSSGASRASTHLGHGNESSMSSTDLSIAGSPAEARIRLSVCLRPPRRQGGGLVFGRSLADATRDTAVHPSFFEKDPWVDERGKPRGENCPSLVVRCVQHLERWGIEEEGLFRIPGRNTHTSRLRSEFDSGADYDLRQSDPVDLDPHSVSSVLKNFLREMPEPIMTHALNSSFDNVLNSASGTSLGFQSQRTAPRSLVDELQRLIWQLPLENRSVLRELCRLLRCTSEHSKTTKMPLSNLALVLCPTLNMHPNVFSLLVQTQDDIFEPLLVDPPAVSNKTDEVNADDSSEESEQEPSRPTPLFHQRSISDMKLMHLTEMSQHNRAFGRTPPASLAPIVVPIPVSASASSSALSTSISTSYTSETPSFNTESSAPTSPYSAVSATATWGRGSKKHMHNVSLPLPVASSHDPFSSTSSLASSVRLKNKRNRQGSTTSTIDEEYDAVPLRPRTPSTLRSLGALLSPKSRSNSNISPSRSTLDNGATGSTPTSTTSRDGGASPGGSSGPSTPGRSTPGRLSRRSSSFFPSTPKLDKLDWGFGSKPSGSLPSRVRKSSGNLKSLVSAPLEAMPENARDKLRPPHLSMTIPGGGTGAFLTSPLTSPVALPSPSSPTPTATAPAPLPTPPTTLRRLPESPSKGIHMRVTSSGTVTVNKRWSGTSNSSKRWSGTGSTMTCRSCKRASWNEPPVTVPAAQVDSTPALGSTSFSSPVSPTAGPSGLGMKSGTPIADLFRASSSSVNSTLSPSFSTSNTSDAFDPPVNDTVATVSMDMGKEGRVQRRKPRAPFPFPGLSLSSPVDPGTATSGAVIRPLPIPPSHPPSSFSGGAGGNAGHVQSAIAALTHVKQSASYVHNARSNNPAATTISSSNPSDDGSSSTSSSSKSLSLPPRLNFGGLRKKHWGRTTNPVSMISAGKDNEDDWASSVLAQMTAGIAQAATPPAIGDGSVVTAMPRPGSSGAEDKVIVEASAIPDGTVRDARRLFETGTINNPPSLPRDVNAKLPTE